MRGRFIVALSRMIILIIAVVGTSLFLYWRKIPVPCFACEISGSMSMCMEGTGKGTHTCERWKKNERKLQAILSQGDKVKQEISEITDTLLTPVLAIEKLLEDIAEFKNKLLLNLPSLKPLAIPEIPELPLKIEFSKIPAFDCCPNIELAINASIGAINTAVDVTVDGINKGINELNTQIEKLGIPKLKNIDVAEIGNIDFTFRIDLAEELRKIGIEDWDIGKDLSDSLNVVIRGLNTALGASVIAINFVIEGMNTAWNFVIDGLAKALDTIVNSMLKTLNSINVFKDIMPLVTDLTEELSELSPLEFVAFLFYRTLQRSVPMGKLLDVAFLIVFVALIVLFVYLMQYVYAVAIPLQDILVIIEEGSKMFSKKFWTEWER